MQKLTIIAGDDIYSANVIEHTGTHIRRKGLGSEQRLPIVLPFDPKHQLGKLDRLEFSREYDFFSEAGAPVPLSTER